MTIACVAASVLQFSRNGTVTDRCYALQLHYAVILRIASAVTQHSSQ